MIRGIHHVALKCRGEAEFEKTIAFYRDLLGMPVVRSWGKDAADAPVEGALRHIAFATDDPDGCIAAVRRAGYPVIEEPHDITIPAEVPFPARIAFCKGPVGEKIEFFCEK